MIKLKYKTRFELPAAESDFVCAISKWIFEYDGSNVQPEEIIIAMIRSYARTLGKDLCKEIWNQAKKDGRGPWK